MSVWFRNGVPVEKVSIDDRAFQYGDGLFETIAIRDGEPRLWAYHMERLAGGCARLRMTIPGRKRLRDDVANAVLQSNELSAYCAAKLIVSTGVGQRGFGRDIPSATETVVGVFPTRPIAAQKYSGGVATILCDTRLATNSVTAGLKTLNRLEQVLARSECVVAGTFEGITLDADDRLICGTMSNVFIVSNESIVTPSLERCGVEGVMRRHTIATLRKYGITVNIRDMSEMELSDSDEVFLTNSQFGVLPVRSYRGKVWHSHPVTRRLMAMMADNGISECVL